MENMDLNICDMCSLHIKQGVFIYRWPLDQGFFTTRVWLAHCVHVLLVLCRPRLFERRVQQTGLVQSRG